MKKMNTALRNLAVLLLIIIASVSCEKDFSNIGTEVIGGTNFKTDSVKYPVIAFNKKVDPVRTDALPLNYLGIYNDPVYGTTNASFISQMVLQTADPTFGENIAMDSVVMTIPYFNTQLAELDDNGNFQYELDSIFGSSYMKVTGYRNNYFLRNFDPETEFEESQQYYSNGATSETGFINLAEVEGDVLFEFPNEDFPDGFKPSSDPIVILDEPDEDGTQDTLRLDVPAFRVPLDTTYWRQAIIDKQGGIELSNQPNFQDYFRGMYIKAEPITGDEGTMMLLNFTSTNANITIYYTRDGIEDANGVASRVTASYTIRFSGNRFNLFDNNYTIPLVDGDAVNGDEKLYLKGAEGSTAKINLFNGDENGESAEFTAFKETFVETDSDGNFVKSKRLVNEASLVFYVDQNAVSPYMADEPERLYIYDLDNKSALIDYFLDPTGNNNPASSVIIHSGRLRREDNSIDDEPGKGIKYKIRVTEHINNLLLRDSTNVKFGLAVAGNINLENGNNQYDILTEESNILDKLPLSSLITPRGTVLFGSNTADEDKKVELEIFYTEPCVVKNDDGDCCENIDVDGNCLDD